MPLTLYFSTPSGPARSVLLLARYLKLDIEVKHINLGAGEQHDPEFLKINPLHKVPVLVDGDYILSESRAILDYLVNSRQPGSDLYPSDAKAECSIMTQETAMRNLMQLWWVQFDSLNSIGSHPRSTQTDAHHLRGQQFNNSTAERWNQSCVEGFE
jgi:glutathione S-transferase